jgi:hypothetical protein
LIFWHYLAIALRFAVMATTLLQTKLTADEWNSVEIPEKQEEIEILNLMINGFHDVNIIYNKQKSIQTLLKLNATSGTDVDEYLFNLYFKKRVDALIKKYKPLSEVVNSMTSNGSTNKKKTGEPIKKIDLMRIQNMQSQIDNDLNKTFDQILMNVVERMLNVWFAENPFKGFVPSPNDVPPVNGTWMYYYYTLCVLLSYHVENCNNQLIEFVNNAISLLKPSIDIQRFISLSHRFVEKNEYVFKYADHSLYEHQKQLFTICKRDDNPKLILYIAPTGTGKTLSPLGLSEKYRVIFVCAARHVGLALAKAAISVKKKIAFAFGCNSNDDIRLHYFAVKEATRDKRSGRIRKVDNSVGDDVEIMICDIRSYIHAMHYMNAFNPLEKLITYWDEPTISMDYEDHPLHAIIHDNWSQNIIPNMVLSSATLPREDEIVGVLTDFKLKFPGAEVHSIISHDFKKSIPLVNRSGFVEVPHFMFGDNYRAVLRCAQHCECYKTLMRYFDLKEIIKFIIYVMKVDVSEDTDDSDDDSDEEDDSDVGVEMLQECTGEDKIYNTPQLEVSRYFANIEDISMTSLKKYYLELLQDIKPEHWGKLYTELTQFRKQLYPSVVNITTSDAHTLTDGPTIYLVDDVNKIARFALQIANIPPVVMSDIMKIIDFNTRLQEEIEKLEKDITDVENSNNSPDDSKKISKIGTERENPTTARMRSKLEELKQKVRCTELNDLFVPNRLEHLRQWTKKKEITKEFTSCVEDEYVEKIMLLNVDTEWKLLLLMGIGAIANHSDKRYTEIMKSLASEQKLYMIVTSTDYIYGTNYQFCHGYIGKDLGNMTQEKAIQAMGRVGRNNIQQDYTLRIRDDEIIRKLFTACDPHDKPEVISMLRLFTTTIDNDVAN